ncbi:4F2 cell-surface antigen heavy chain-like [Solea senegalensis]|uniref:4F2 cell-surface antigen heavy chain-like n=2 Tax=Solea senegalensis TaxID=28829 RepID=A0AAV6Q234_SOLSE|nr:4F2 cell-surface antigen heavy chain isoform X2 [Solea senegalensis]KAG7480051.1 4F2 cell-surface antigen heavy chain-like [Solea senegalensis]
MDHAEESHRPTHRMPLNAGDNGYGSAPGPGLSASVGGTETAPLLIPEPEPEPEQQWLPLSKEELEAAAGGPLWRRVRCYLVLLFWLAWVAMLATAIAIIVMSPRPVVIPLKWWQKTVFYELQPAPYMEAPQGLNVLCEQLPYLRSLGIGTLILQGLFSKEVSASNLTMAAQSSGTLPQIQHLLTESNKAGLKVMLDFCGLDLNGSHVSDTEQRSLRFWLEQGVAGFVICDTDAAYSEKTLLEWRDVLMEFDGQEDEERIVVVKQTQHVLLPLNNSDQINRTLADVVMRPILPSSQHPLSAQEVADAIETHLQTKDEKIWPSWTVGGEASHDLKRLLLVLTMTLPGSPALQYDEDIDQTQDNGKERRSAVTLFTSLSHSRAREEALMYGSFTFLPFNTSSTNSSSSPNSTVSSPSSPTVLAFLRSWGCVHFLVLLNVGSEPHALDPAWAPTLPEAGVFVTSSGLDRLGSTSLYMLVLKPHEAIVIKLFEGGSYS